MLRFILLVGAVIAVIIGYFALGFADPETDRRCPGCGLASLMIEPQGYVGGRTHFVCGSCGAHYYQAPDGSLVK